MKTESYDDEAAFDFETVRCGKCDGRIKRGDLIRKTPEGWNHLWHYHAVSNGEVDRA